MTVIIAADFNRVRAGLLKDKETKEKGHLSKKKQARKVRREARLARHKAKDESLLCKDAPPPLLLLEKDPEVRRKTLHCTVLYCTVPHCTGWCAPDWLSVRHLHLDLLFNPTHLPS